MYIANPALLGFPILLSSITTKTQAADLTILDTDFSSRAENFNTNESSMQWGIYDYESSTIALTVESILEINYNKSAEVSVYPVEKGLFASYNKVLRPAEVKVEIATGGAYNYLSQSYITWRIAVLKWFEDALNNLTAYDIVMPEKRYSNYTLISYTIRRDKMSGSGLIIADCIFKEVVDMSQLNKTFTQRNTNNSDSPNDYGVGAINFISPANFDGVA